MSTPLDSEINLKLQNIMMLLRKCCNHPYLIEYPLDAATQQFKVIPPIAYLEGLLFIPMLFEWLRLMASQFDLQRTVRSLE